MSNNKSIVKSTVLVTIVTFVIKFLGLIKQSVLAAYCGATDETDAFFIASGVLVSLCTMMFSAISISLLSIHTKKLVDEGREAANRLINLTLRVFLPFSILTSLLFVIGAPLFAKFFAPSYQAEQLDLLAHYIRIMSVVYVLWCYYLTVNVVLETDKCFVPGRMQGFFQNVFLIFAALFTFGKWGMESLLWAFILSGVAECLLVTWCARSLFKPILRKITDSKGDVMHLLKLSGPLILGNALYEINDIVDKQISSGLGTGNVSYLTYGSTINEIVTGVVVGSISVVLFSHFATWVAEGDIKKVAAGLNKSVELLILIIFPIMSLCLFAGDDILTLFYSRGNFGEEEVKITQTVVVGYAIGFIFAAIRANVVKVFYAFQDTRRPLYNGAFSIMVNVFFSIVLSRILGVGGIALATSLAMIISTVMLFIQIKTHIRGLNISMIKKEILKGVVAFIVSSVLIVYCHNHFNLSSTSKILIETIVCFSIYVIVLAILKADVMNFKTIRNKIS